MDSKTCKNCKFFRNYEGDTFCRKDNKTEQISKQCLDTPCPFHEPDREPITYSRVDSDLDSIEVSADPRRKIKIYFNTRSDTKAEVERRIVDACLYADLAVGLLKGEVKDV
jgi:hypothetical protein